MLTDFQNYFTLVLGSDCIRNDHQRSHHILNTLLHYLVKLYCSENDLINTLINTSCSLSVMSLETGLLISDS